MNMREIEVICELTNYNSFAEAAFSMAYSPSVITNYVANVEEELGIKLFFRSKKSSSLKLTPEGKVLIDSMQHIRRSYQHLCEITKQLKVSKVDTLRIGSQQRLRSAVEEEIMASFLIRNPNAHIESVKMPTVDILNLLQAGKLDAAFLFIHEDVQKDEYFSAHEGAGGLEIRFLDTQRDMYLMLSQDCFAGRTEAKFSEFKDFSFIFPYPIPDNEQESKAFAPFKRMAEKSGIKLKTIFMGGDVTASFAIATMMAGAVVTTNPMVQYSGTKLMRISDWDNSSDMYFICQKNTLNKALIQLKKCINDTLHWRQENNHEVIL